MKRKRLFGSVAALTAVTLVLAACGEDEGAARAEACSAGRLKGYALGPAGRPDVTAAGAVHAVTAKTKPTVKIGMFGDLTGDGSILTLHIRDAAAFAIERANQAGNLEVRVELLPVSNEGERETAPEVEQQLIDDEDVVGVIGGALSGETRAAGPLFDQAGLTHISASALGPDITARGWPFFRVLSADAVQGAKVAALLRSIGCASVAVVDDETDYGKNLADIVDAEARKAGLTVVARESVGGKTTDYSPLIEGLLAASPDAIFYGGYHKGGSLIAKQAKEKALDALFVCGDGCKDAGFVAGAGAAAEGAVFTCPCRDLNVSTEAEAQAFAQDYQVKYGEPVGIYGAEAYDAATIFIAAIDASDEDGRVTRREVLDFVDSLESFKGLTKVFSFDETGELAGGAIFVYAVRDGAIKELGEVDEIGA